jgi:ketosteroid isomerase-like protein
MSQENVEIVRRAHPGPDVDIAALVRDDELNRRTFAAISPLFDPEFECVLHFPGAEPATYEGLKGFRAGWRDWLAPWATYRAVIEELVDLGDRVLVMVRDYGRSDPGSPEIEQIDAAIWTVRDGRIVRAEFYTVREEALRDAGLTP